MIALLLGVALAAPLEPATLVDLGKLASRGWTAKQRVQVEQAMTAEDPTLRVVAAALLYADDPARWADALRVELVVRNQAAKAEGRVELLAPQEVQGISSRAAAGLPKDAPPWLGSCSAFVAWRERVAFVHTAAETIDVVRLYRRDCVDGAWRRSVDAGKLATVAVLDGLDASE
jgi:hypothetical protein